MSPVRDGLRAIGCDEVWIDSAGNALGRIGRGPRVILYDAHLDTNEVRRLNASGRIRRWSQ